MEASKWTPTESEAARSFSKISSDKPSEIKRSSRKKRTMELVDVALMTPKSFCSTATPASGKSTGATSTPVEQGRDFRTLKSKMPTSSKSAMSTKLDLRSERGSSVGTPSAASRASRQCGSPRPPKHNLDVGVFGTWRRGNRIGSGSHGSVFKAQDTVTGQIFAVKMAEVDMNDENAEKLEAELLICKDLRHPHIVRYLGHEYLDAKLCIKLEYVPGGSLLALLSEFGPLEGAMMQTGSRALLEGLSYLHTHNPPVVHRDIKGANVLVDTNFCLKLADFGCSKRSSDTQSFVTIGSVPWMAPEVINGKSGHGRKADIWSLGCTFIEMATAEKPWGENKFNNIMFALRHIGMSEETPPIPEALAEEGQDIIRRCVQRDPHNRMRIQELLDHEFVRGVRSTRSR